MDVSDSLRQTKVRLVRRQRVACMHTFSQKLPAITQGQSSPHWPLHVHGSYLGHAGSPPGSLLPLLPLLCATMPRETSVSMKVCCWQRQLRLLQRTCTNMVGYHYNGE